MSRGLHADTLTALSGTNLRPVHLVEIQLLQATVRLNDSPRPVVFGGVTFSPAGHLLGIGSAAERLDVAVERIAISLSGVDQLYLSVLLQYDYRNRKVQIWRGYLPASGMTLIADPIKIWEGRATQPVIQEVPSASGENNVSGSGSSTITLYAANIWYDHQRAVGRVFSDACQQTYFPNDRGLEFSGQAFDNLPWGRST